MSSSPLSLDEVRERGLLRNVHYVIKAGRGLWATEGSKRPLLIAAEEWELLDAGVDIRSAKNHGLGHRL